MFLRIAGACLSRVVWIASFLLVEVGDSATRFHPLITLSR